MEQLTTLQEMRTFRETLQGRVGLVPTMGYLHEGHLSLIRKAAGENDHVIVSLFVNPSQFGPEEDLDRYPRDLERDAALCAGEGVRGLFIPSAGEIYPDGYQTYIEVTRLTQHLCGLSRPTHFRGVCTIVGKLFHLVRPGRAYFGLKDYQQYKVIERMVKDLHFSVDVIPCPIVREDDGLAMSSRNKYLSKKGRREALVLQQALREARQALDHGERSAHHLQAVMEEIVASVSSARLDYARVVDAETLEPFGGEINPGGTLFALAVYVENTRLIDNMVWSNGQ
jgi:pantoate--beta-alanine ligase